VRYAGEDVAFTLNAVCRLAALLAFWRALPGLRAAARPVYIRLGLIGRDDRPGSAGEGR
jgi:hypothetical protein